MNADSLEVPAEKLRRRLDPADLPFKTTAEVEPLTGTIGQPRALDAIEFGLEIGTVGYNLFIAGAPGSGRESTILDYLARVAEGRPTPGDWVYVYNFREPDRPNALRLPAGVGTQFKTDMDEFVAAATQEISRAFESEEYERRRRDAISGIAQERERLTEALKEFAQERGFALEFTPVGVVTVPLYRGQPLSGEDLQRLPSEQRDAIEQRAKEIREETAGVQRQLRQLEKQVGEQVRELDRETATFAVGHLLDDLREKYRELSEVLEYLADVENDIPDHLRDFRPEAADEESPVAQLQTLERESHLTRFAVNVIVDNAQTQGVPIEVERNPTYYNLAGRIDYRSAFGTMVTDFRQIKAGALHRANGGFLVLDMLDMLRQPFTWDALKRALLSGEVRIENLSEQFSTIPTATLRPEPIPIDLKVVLLGSPVVYHLLYQLDGDFRELFKVKAHFAPDMDWSDEHVTNYAAFIRRCVEDADLRHFGTSAVARVVEHGARLRDDQRRLSTRLLDISDLVAEASFWAGKNGHEVVRADDVDRAIEKKDYRSNLVEERIHELISDGTLMIDVSGERVAQVNGLAVLDLGDYVFAKPSRVTARVSLGRGMVESIERSIELSGPIHSKGFMILSGYLAGTYAQELPLAVRATITFEQAYDEVEGDSASSTELYALLSALSDLPLKQGIAVTGSVNQHGDIQAVGEVTRKIEGFYAVCKAKGFTAEQGVIIPKANVSNLMLDDELVEACDAGTFHIWAISTIDEGIEILSGRPAGVRQPDGTFSRDSVHRLVEERLREYAERLQAFGASEDKHEDGNNEPPV